MDHRPTPLDSHPRIAVVASGLLMIWAFAESSLLSAPLAVLFVGLTFWWTINRPDPAAPATVAAAGACLGCADGCVECRERIDLAGPSGRSGAA